MRGGLPGEPNADGSTVDSVVLPSRTDAVLAGESGNDGGMDLAWLLASGGLITGTGAAFVVRSRGRG